MNTFQKITLIASIAGTNDKLAKLREIMDPTLERVFHLALSSEYTFGIKKIPAFTKEADSMTLDAALDIMEKSFCTNRVTGNTRLDLLSLILACVSADDAEVVKRVITGKLDCGVSVSNANKCMTNTIPVFDTMLCAKQDQKLIDKLFAPNNQVVAQVKSDGMRVIISVDGNSKVRYRTRNGKDLTLPQRYTEYFAQFPDVCFDGEALIAAEDGNGYADRKTGNGLLNSIRQGKASDQDADRIRFVLWDIIGYDDYMAGHSDAEYMDRYNDLVQCNTDYADDTVWNIVETKSVANFDEAQAYYNEVRERGEEGLILKDVAASFQAKRVKHQIKMKAEETLDLRVVEMVEGTGKNAGRLGAVICEDESGNLRVSVGSGFTEADRELFWKESIIGSIIEVKYNEVIKSKGSDKLSLFLPIFDRVRDDKKVADTVGA